MKTRLTLTVCVMTLLIISVSNAAQSPVTREQLDTEYVGSEYALQFDGLDDFVSIVDSGDFDLNSTFTIEVWIKPSSVIGSSSTKAIVQGTCSEPPVLSTSWTMYLSSSDYSSWGLNVCDNSHCDGLRTKEGVLQEQWQHLAGVFSGAIYLYHNGDSVGSMPISVDNVNDISYILVGIGETSFNGIIGEVRIWNIARTQTEIQATMNSVLNGDEPGLIGYWRLNEGSGQIVFDSTPNNNNGRLGSSLTSDTSDPIWVESDIPINQCTTPYFSQRDSRWINYPLRTNGECSPSCNTIGACGCTLTSAAMVFAHYGANLTPPELSDCLGISACPFYWKKGETCSENRTRWINRYSFSWNRLDHEINQNKHPVILGMHRDNNTHWVVVLDGNSSDPANYTIHDPWPIHGADMKLDVYGNRGWHFDWLSIYAGQSDCGSLAMVTATVNQAVLYPQPVKASVNPEMATQHLTLTTIEAQDIAASSVITGSAWLYRMTAVTMTVQLTATSGAGVVGEMLAWTDSMTQTTWQPFSDFVYLPISDEIYVRFCDTSDNVSEIASDTLHPVASPLTAPFEIFLPSILRY